MFDHRRAEAISDDVIAHCHQCGEPADTHVNCANEACHLLFIQCSSCQERMKTCCSDECREIYELPFEEQKELRRGKQESNKIFKKGRSEKLKFKSRVSAQTICKFCCYDFNNSNWSESATIILLIAIFE